MDKTFWKSNVSRAPEPGALDMAGVQIVVSIDQTRLQKGLLDLYFNPRPAGGGGCLNAPPHLRFFEDSENTAVRSAAGFSPTLPHPHLFRNFCDNFDPRPCEVRSPGQVKWPNYKITFPSRQGYNVSGKVMTLSEYDEVISAYKTYIQKT